MFMLRGESMILMMAGVIGMRGVIRLSRLGALI
jgi:hypothetical protein